MRGGFNEVFQRHWSKDRMPNEILHSFDMISAHAHAAMSWFPIGKYKVRTIRGQGRVNGGGEYAPDA